MVSLNPLANLSKQSVNLLDKVTDIRYDICCGLSGNASAPLSMPKKSEKEDAWRLQHYRV